MTDLSLAILLVSRRGRRSLCVSPILVGVVERVDQLGHDL